MSPCKQDPQPGIICDPALQEYLLAYFGGPVSLKQAPPEEGGMWVLSDDLGICGIGADPYEALHNAQDWLDEYMPAKSQKGCKTYWVDTCCTSGMIMTTNSMVVWSSWGKRIQGRKITDALAYLKKTQRHTTVRKVLGRHYFTPLEMMEDG